MRKTHQAVGIAVATTIMSSMHTIGRNELILGCAIAMTASTIPDVDNYDAHKISLLHDIEITSVVLMLYSIIMGVQIQTQFLTIYIVLLAITIPFPHRAFSHSIWGCLLYTFLFHNIIGRNMNYTLWFMLAYMSHPFIDLLNCKDVKILYPYGTCFKLCKSDGIGDELICTLFKFISFVNIARILYGASILTMIDKALNFDINNLINQFK